MSTLSTPLPRVALITNLLSHYRIPCFQRLSQALAGRIVFFTLAQDMLHRRYVLADEPRDLPVVRLGGWQWHRPPFDDRHVNNVLPVLKTNPKVLILSGWDEPTYLLLWAWGVLTRKRILFWIESTTHDGPRTGLKETVKRRLLKHASGCVVPGQRAREYCRALGVPEEHIFIAPNAINQDYFRSAAVRLLPQRAQLRERLNIKNEVVILYVGRLVEFYKNLSTLFRSYALLAKQGTPTLLVIVGDGPDRSVYEALAQNLNIRNVRFVGLLAHDALCEYYSAADILVLPSASETWGFVLNEGMEFGLPLVVSEAVGAGPDLVREGENGYVVPVGSVDLLAVRLRQLVEDANLRERMGTRSRQLVQDFSPANWADGMANAIRFAAGKRINGR
jgi:glycosyltransferase involved in cell wall biosynthesis